MSSVTNRNVAWTQMAWENYFLSTMFLICFLSLLIALKQREVVVKCSLIVICFLLKGHLCHNPNKIRTFHFASLWTQKSPPCSLIFNLIAKTLLLFTRSCLLTRKKKRSENKVFFCLSVCSVCPTCDIWPLRRRRKTGQHHFAQVDPDVSAS